MTYALIYLALLMFSIHRVLTVSLDELTSKRNMLLNVIVMITLSPIFIFVFIRDKIREK